jgi:hypothetical protein
MFICRGLFCQLQIEPRISSKTNKEKGFEAYSSGSTPDQASTLARILKQTRLSLEDFQKLL